MVIVHWPSVFLHHTAIHIVMALPIVLVVDDLTLVVLHLVEGVP